MKSTIAVMDFCEVEPLRKVIIFYSCDNEKGQVRRYKIR